MAKKKPTEQELKDRLWAIVKQTDFENDGLDYSPDFDEWQTEYLSIIEKKFVKVEGFEASLVDINKIIKEVEDSCLTDKCKKSLTKSLKSAIK